MYYYTKQIQVRGGSLGANPQHIFLGAVVTSVRKLHLCRLCHSSASELFSLYSFMRSIRCTFKRTHVNDDVQRMSIIEIIHMLGSRFSFANTGNVHR